MGERAVGASTSEERRRPPLELLRFKELYDAGQFWHAHEALEGLWRATADSALATLYRGMIQLAAAYLHLERGNLRGGARLLRKAASSLLGCPPDHATVRADLLVERIRSSLAAVEAGAVAAPPALPLTEND